MTVLGNRVLIKPDAQPEADGAILLPEHRDWVSTSGTVVQVGPGGSKLRYDARQRALKAAIEAIQKPHGSTNDWFHAGIKIAVERVSALLGSCDLQSDLTVGDRVAFDSDHGLSMTIDGENYLILNQDDVVIIVEEAEAA